MNYQETINYLYHAAPLFQHLGAEAYKEGLFTTLALDEHFMHPHRRFTTIHIAGTNGKGSCSHTIAAVLQSAGYKVGLFTSPHLVDFRERIRINGTMIPEDYVVKFVEEERGFFEPLHPSFFELTTALAFKYFADSHIDIAVVEVGLGGRIDCTNIVHPCLSVITNISFDHQQFLGHTLAAIAGEKAGIIKPGVPVVVGETTAETRPVFQQRAQKVQAPVVWAEDQDELESWEPAPGGGLMYHTQSFGQFYGCLGGLCQEHNARTILAALQCLRGQGLRFSDDDIREGFAAVCRLTGLRGRWEILHHTPFTVCDTGHNVGGMQYIARQLEMLMEERRREAAEEHCDPPVLRIVFGMAGDKDVGSVLRLLPHDAEYYFCQASVKRALPAAELEALAALQGLKGRAVGSVAKAYGQARKDAMPEDVVFVGGSSFVVADLLEGLEQQAHGQR